MINLDQERFGPPPHDRRKTPAIQGAFPARSPFWGLLRCHAWPAQPRENALRVEPLDPTLGLPPAEEKTPRPSVSQAPPDEFLQHVTIRGHTRERWPLTTLRRQVVQAPEDPPSRVATQRGTELPTRSSPVAATPRHPLSPSRAREDWDTLRGCDMV